MSGKVASSVRFSAKPDTASKRYRAKPKKSETRQLVPDVKRYYRPYLGVCYDPKTGGLKEQRFNLGTDAMLAEYAISRLTQLWGHIVATFIDTGSIGPFKPHWNEFTLWLGPQKSIAHAPC